MKKYTTGLKYRVRQERLRKIRARQRVRIKLNLYVRRCLAHESVSFYSSEYLERHFEEETIVAPFSFDLLNNSHEMMCFFDRLYKTASKDKVKIFVDLSAVEIVTHSSILYLCSVLDLCKKCNTPVRGNYPDYKSAKEIFYQSAFKTHLKAAKIKKEVGTASYLTLWGTNSEPERSCKIIDFIAKKIPHAPHLKDYQRLLVECMTNTHNHAYKRGKLPKKLKALNKLPEKKWWLSANYDEDSAIIHITFLDNGAGVPHTLQKNFSDIIRKLFPGSSSTDVSLIKSAFEGEFRTTTKKKERGLGLPAIYERVKNGILTKFHMLSGRAAFHPFESGFAEEALPSQFIGTLYSWEIKIR